MQSSMAEQKSSLEQGKLIGRVSHYFDKIGVAVVKLSAPLTIGDTVRIVGGAGTDFQQKAISMEKDYKKIKRAKKGESVGIKLKEKARPGYKLYKL